MFYPSFCLIKKIKKMKNLLLILFVALSVTLFSQEKSCCAKKEEPSKYSYYMSAGLSMSNTLDNTFSFSSYPSIEVGGMYENISLGLVLGRGNLSGFKNDIIRNYWYEVKTSVSKQIGVTMVYGVFGVGNYIDTKRVFIEYGAGASYIAGSFGYFVQATNWDNAWYVTPGITYNF